MVLVGWKGKLSLRAYIPKSERVHYLRLCGADVSKFEVNKFERERLAANGGVKDDTAVAAEVQDHNDIEEDIDEDQVVPAE